MNENKKALKRRNIIARGKAPGLKNNSFIAPQLEVEKREKDKWSETDKRN